MELERVSYAYDKRNDRVKNVSCTVEPGAVTAIIGPNGSGKSTLLGIMANHYAPRTGAVLLDGAALSGYSPKALARKLAVVLQINAAPADWTVERLAALGRWPHRSLWSPRGEDDGEAIRWALECTGLLAKRDCPVGDLSGGERQRAWIAMALAQRTPMLLLDEPTTYLDVYYQLELLELIRRLNREHGLTIAMVLHDINQAIRYGDRIIVMKDGEAILAGAPREVLTEETLRHIYGVDVRIREDPEAGLFVIPLGAGRAAKRAELSASATMPAPT